MARATWLLLIGWFSLQVRRAHDQALEGGGGDPFGDLPSHLWYDISSPFTESHKESLEPQLTGTPEPQPYFEDGSAAANVTTQFGSSVFLHCRVNDLGDKTVSWLRRKGDQLQLLTFGLHTYSSDSRYSLSYRAPNDWRLLVEFCNERDAGHYECQVSTHPPLVCTVTLHVVVPRVDAVDERGLPAIDKFYKAGSTIELRCVVRQSPHPSAYAVWRHGGRVLNYDTSRGGISVKTDVQPGGAVSRLFIANAHKLDSGNYTCSLADIASATVTVHVLNGETPAAMQHGACSVWSKLNFVKWAILPLGPAWLLLTGNSLR